MLILVFWGGGRASATSIVVRVGGNQEVAVAADSKRGTEHVDVDGKAVRGKSLYVCKICTADNGVFLAAGFAVPPYCDTAQQLSRSVARVSQRAGAFAAGAFPALTTILQRMAPALTTRFTTPNSYLLELMFVGGEVGRVSYNVALIKARRNGTIEAYVDTVETCPPVCREYVWLGSGAAQAYIDANSTALMKLPAIDFVRKVVGETEKMDPAAGGEISSGIVSVSGFTPLDFGVCRFDESGTGTQRKKK